MIGHEVMSSLTLTASRKVAALLSSSSGYDLNNWVASDKKCTASISNAASDIKSSAKFMSSWGRKEGDDVLDMTEHLDLVFNAFADALDKVAIHNENHRKLIKEIRISEEALLNMHAKRKTTQGEIEKLSKKMKPIDELSAELANIDRQLLEMEANVFTAKRQKLYNAASLQFDAMAELSVKSNIIATQGRQLIERIHQTPIYPGEGAPTYSDDERAYTRRIVETMNSDLLAITPESTRIPVNTYAANSRYATDNTSIVSGFGDASLVSDRPPQLSLPVHEGGFYEAAPTYTQGYQ